MKKKLICLFSTLLLSTLPLVSGCITDDSESNDMSAADKLSGANGEDGKHQFIVDSEGIINFKAKIVYFHFDDFTLTADGMARLDALSNYMQKKSILRLKIEGHCDSRGSTEYNLALGQLRAQTVRKYLATQGISNKRLVAVSFGEEKPAAAGSSEDAWAKNRRAEFSFVSR